MNTRPHENTPRLIDLITKLTESKFLPTSVEQIGGCIERLPKAKWLDFVNRIEKPSVSEGHFYMCVQHDSSLNWYGELLKVGSTITAYDFTLQKQIVFQSATFPALQPVDCFYVKSGVLHGGELFLRHVKDIDFHLNFSDFFVKETDLKMEAEELAWFQAIAAHQVEDCIRLASGRNINRVVEFPIRLGSIYQLTEISPFTLSIVVKNFGFSAWAIANGADVDKAIGSDQMQPLHYCTWFGDHHLLRILLAYCKNPGELNKNGLTPLHIVVGAKQDEMVRLLLAAGADPNAGAISGGPDGRGMYPVLSRVNMPVFRLLQQYGANWNVTCRKSGQTPLHYNSDRFSRDVFIELVTLGLDPNQADYRGKTPFDLLRSDCGEETFSQVCWELYSRGLVQEN